MIGVDAFTEALRWGVWALVILGGLVFLFISVQPKHRKYPHESKPARFKRLPNGFDPNQPKHMPPAYKPCAKCPHRP